MLFGSENILYWPNPFNPVLLYGVKGDYEGFRNALGNRESTNNYTVVNRYGYMGRYQFGSARLNELYNNYDLPQWSPRSNFLSNPALQDQYFDVHVQDLAPAAQAALAAAQNHWGNSITLSGLIAAAHLKGPGGMRRYANGDDNCDANGTCTSDYASQFNGYDIPNFDSSGSEGIAHQGIDITPGAGGDQGSSDQVAMQATPVLITAAVIAALLLW